MAQAADMVFTTRDYIQGDDAPTSLQISGGRYSLVMRGDRINGEMPGIGVFEGMTSPDEDVKLADAFEKSKKLRDRTPFTPSPLINDFVHAYFRQGQKVAKLDAITAISRKDGALLLTISFINSGQKSITFESPARWKGQFNPIMGYSWIRFSGRMKIEGANSIDFGTNLFGGSEMVNAADYPDGWVTIPPGQARQATFKVFPEEVIKPGTYDSGASIVIQTITAPEGLKGSAEMISLQSKVAFPHGYPSTPQEVKAFKSHQAEKQKDAE